LLAIGRARAGPIAGACETLSDVMGRFVRGVMWAAPVAVFCLLAPAVAGLGLGVLKALSVYCLCVVGGLVLVMGGVYAPLIAGLARMSPIRFFHALGPAQLVAFSSSSSNATLPVTMQCVVERVGVPRSIAGFVCPLGATVNMDGTSVYLGVAVAFITQALGIELTLGQQLMLVVSITLAAVGSPGIPGGSLVFLVAMLQGLGVPAEGVALILGVDRLLDMARTVVNVVGDGVASAVVARLERSRAGEVSSTGHAP
jgi:Na+/H+-dicarboxylate symporter